MPKLVSIIFPTNANNMNLLMESFSTLVNQSYQSWEVIVLKPETVDLEFVFSSTYGNIKDRFRFIDVSDDLSIGEIRNIGIEKSRGSYISYLDDDDLWSKDYLKNQIERLEQNLVDLVYCNHHLRIQIFNNLENNYFQHFISIPYSVHPFDRNVLLTEPFIKLSCVVHTKEVTEIIKFSDLTSFEDWLFLLNASKIFKFDSSSNTLVTIQKRLDFTNNKTKLGNESIKNLRFILEQTQSQIEDEQISNIRDVIFSEFAKEYRSFFDYENTQLDIILKERGIDFAYGYLKYLLISGIIDSNICKKGYEIASGMNNIELANDLLFLSDWYEGINLQSHNNYKLTYFTRKSGKWNASL
jgi:glycosyltransferase involved in cell wall biosynthesis